MKSQKKKDTEPNVITDELFERMALEDSPEGVNILSDIVDALEDFILELKNRKKIKCGS